MKYLLPVLLLAVFSLPTRAEIDFDTLKGKVVYLDFWASWCGPCKSSFPWMDAMHRKYAAQGLEIIAVNMDQEPELAQSFIDEFQPGFHIEYDSQGKLADTFGVEAMPTSFLIDKQGKVRVSHKGFHQDRRSSYEQEIQEMLGDAL